MIISDLVGVKVVTLQIDGFDFKKMYEAFANLFGFICKMDYAIEATNEDEHPLSYLRVDIILSQQAKFKEIYDLKPSDGMYVLDEKNIMI